MSDHQKITDEDCRTGFAWKGQPQGSEKKIGDLDVYIAGASSTSAVLMIHDIFGWKMRNNRLLADHYAQEAKVTVYLVDFFKGEALPEESMTDPEKRKLLDYEGFRARNEKSIRRPEVFTVAKELRAKYKSLGAIGFCWGAYGAFQIAAKGENLLDCVAVAHASLTKKEEMDTLAVPTLIIAPEVDAAFSPEFKEHAQKVLPTLGIDYSYQYYHGVKHGFATRGDREDSVQRKALERAKDDAVHWFNKYLH